MLSEIAAGSLDAMPPYAINQALSIRVLEGYAYDLARRFDSEFQAAGFLIMWKCWCKKCDYLASFLQPDKWEKCARGMAMYTLPMAMHTLRRWPVTGWRPVPKSRRSGAICWPRRLSRCTTACTGHTKQWLLAHIGVPLCGQRRRGCSTRSIPPSRRIMQMLSGAGSF